MQITTTTLPNTVIDSGPYKGFVIRSITLNGWVKMYHPSNVVDGNIDSATIGSRLHLINQQPPSVVSLEQAKQLWNDFLNFKMHCRSRIKFARYLQDCDAAGRLNKVKAQQLSDQIIEMIRQARTQ